MKSLVRVILIGSLFSLGWGIAHAEPSIEQVSLAVLGEALHDPESMRYMAHAVLNRGSLKGVYGYKVALRTNYTPKIRLMASNSVEKARLEAVDPVKGADHWLSDYDLAHCRPEMMAWRHKMVETAYQGQTHYYREV